MARSQNGVVRSKYTPFKLTRSVVLSFALDAVPDRVLVNAHLLINRGRGPPLPCYYFPTFFEFSWISFNGFLKDVLRIS